MSLNTCNFGILPVFSSTTINRDKFEAVVLFMRDKLGKASSTPRCWQNRRKTVGSRITGTAVHTGNRIWAF